MTTRPPTDHLVTIQLPPLPAVDETQQLTPPAPPSAPPAPAPAPVRVALPLAVWLPWSLSGVLIAVLALIALGRLSADPRPVFAIAAPARPASATATPPIAVPAADAGLLAIESVPTVGPPVPVVVVVAPAAPELLPTIESVPPTPEPAPVYVQAQQAMPPVIRVDPAEGGGRWLVHEDTGTRYRASYEPPPRLIPAESLRATPGWGSWNGGGGTYGGN